MALLVKFTVVGQVLLGYQAEQLSVADNRRAVVQLAVVRDRQPDQRNQIQAGACVQDRSQPVLSPLQQRVLQKQVTACVAGQAKFGEADQLHILGGVHAHGVDDLLRVIGAVGHAQGGGGGSHSDKSIFKSGKAVLHSPNFLYCIMCSLIITRCRANRKQNDKKKNIKDKMYYILDISRGRCYTGYTI